MNRPKILIFDIETAPITGYLWGLHDQNLGINQIKKDWHLLGWAAKWYEDPASKTMYMDNRASKDVGNDRKLVAGLWKLLDEADIVVTQNGDKFDIKKFNARAIIHGMVPPSYYKSTDVYKESRKVFGFTSQSLEYTSNILNVKYKKLKHSKFPGMELWTEILKGNQSAWREMKTYCISDVLSTEEKFQRIYKWIKVPNQAVYVDDEVTRCVCGSDKIIKKGPIYTDSGKFQGYKCLSCGKRPHGRTNLLSTVKKRNLLREKK